MVFMKSSQAHPASLDPTSLDRTRSSDRGDGDAPGLHLKTFTHEGRFWDVYLDVVDDSNDSDSCRARLAFLPADRTEDEEPAQTAVVIIESNYEDALEVALGFDRYHLSSMLRSVI